MAGNGLVSVNVPTNSSAVGLREELELIARKRATSLSRVVAQIYTFAVGSKHLVPEELDSPRAKPGRHISTEVPEAVSKALGEWATDHGRSRAHHCCFILEYFLTDAAIQRKVFPNRTLSTVSDAPK